MPQMNNREYRMLAPMKVQSNEKRIDSNYYVEGYAARWEPYVLWEEDGQPVYEKFDRNCFAGCDMTDVIMQYDHSGKVYARLSNNTLIVEPNDEGLFIAADLSKSEASRNLFEEISNGLITKMSWGFIPQEYHYDKENRTIVHTKVKKVFDVSAVSIPANDTTNIQARSLVNGEIRQVLQELKDAELEREKLLLKLKIGGF